MGRENSKVSEESERTSAEPKNSKGHEKASGGSRR